MSASACPVVGRWQFESQRRSGLPNRIHGRVVSSCSRIPSCEFIGPPNSGGSCACRGQPYPTAEEARITCAIVDATAKVRDLNFKNMAEDKGAPVTARFGADGITICDPNRASEGADKVFQKIYERPI